MKILNYIYVLHIFINIDKKLLGIIIMIIE